MACFTQEGFNKIQAQINGLEDRKRQLSVAIGEAAEQGDLSENAEYTAAKEDMALVETRIGELMVRLSGATIVDPTKYKDGKVHLGSIVKLKARKEEFEVHIVTGEEVDHSDVKISAESPMGLALIGKSVGDQIEFSAPVGKQKYTILNIK